MIVNLAIATIASSALTYYFKLTFTKSLIAAVAIFICLSVISNISTTEGFLSDTDDNARHVRYGDRIVLWTHKNRMLRMNPYKRNGTKAHVDVSAYLSNPSEIPRTWVWDIFTIEDAADIRWNMGSQATIKYGDTIYLRSWMADIKLGHTWMSPGKNNFVGGRQTRGKWGKLTLESPDATGQKGQPIKYGDPIYLKTWRTGMYVTHPESGSGSGYSKIKQTTKKDYTCVFRIFDDYGQAQQVDWATRGTATQDTQHRGFRASNAINGSNTSISHTQNKQNAWWQVELPRDINISEINITNRTDCCKERLQDFDVIVSDREGKAIYQKYFKDSLAQYDLTGINRIGRTVKVQLRGKNFLHITKVQVFGTPINYSTSMETPVVADLITAPIDMTDVSSRQFHNDTIPYIGKNNSISMTLFIKPKSGNTGKRHIVTKGNLMLLLEERHLLMNINTASGQASIKVNSELSADTWSHIGITIRPTVSSMSGWLYGEFSSKPTGITEGCCYAVNKQRREYYHIKEQGVFASATRHTWSANVVKGMKYLGELTDNVPVMTIYMNGNLDGEHKLDSDIKLTNAPLIVGQYTSNDSKVAGKGLIGQVHGLRVYNYEISKETAYRDSRSQHNALTLDLVRTKTDGSLKQTIGANMLPTIKDEVSISYWIQSRGATKKWQSIFVIGTSEKDKSFGMWITPKGNLFSTVRTFGGSINGHKEIKYKVMDSVWYHVVEVFSGKTQMVYINGQRVANIDHPRELDYSIVPITIGGFDGTIKDFRYHNYALSNNEVRAQMGIHPDYEEHDVVQKIWHDQGCVTNLFDDPEEHTDLVTLIKNDNKSSVVSKLKSIQVSAHKGDKKKLIQCYGPYASELFRKLQKSRELLQHTLGNEQGKKCLPIAPFTCKDKAINDFDIRTHKDFHKYTLTDRIIPSVRSKMDIKNHPDFNKYKVQLEKSKRALKEMTNMRVKSEKDNMALTAKLQCMKKKGNNDIINHPLYIEVHNKYKSGCLKLAQIKKEQGATLKALNQAHSEASSVTRRPEYKRIALQLKNARKSAMCNVSGKMPVREKPELKDGIVSKTSKTKLHVQKKDLKRIHADTKKHAKDIFYGTTGLDSKTVNNIIISKQDLSNEEEYQDMISKIKKQGSNVDIKKHPEYQILVNKLNKMTTDQVDRKTDSYHQLKVQAHKCTALFESGVQKVSSKVLAKLFKERAQTDPQFKALISNIVESKALSDSDFSKILQKAQDEKYINNPNFKEFLMKVTRKQLKSDPVYAKVVAAMIGAEPGRLEDHPEYNKYANDMRRQKCSS